MSEHWTQFQPGKKSRHHKETASSSSSRIQHFFLKTSLYIIFKNSLPVGHLTSLPNVLASDVQPKINTETVGNGTEEN